MSAAITNKDDTIDSRAVIERIGVLKSNLEVDFDDATSVRQAAGFDSDDFEELANLLELAEGGEDYSRDWEHGVTLIHDDHIQDYAKQLAEETGAVNSDAKWPNNCIDWGQAAKELLVDYTGVDFAGQTYWVR
jgi:hypothetical protein